MQISESSDTLHYLSRSNQIPCKNAHTTCMRYISTPLDDCTNGKVERVHRMDSERFYSNKTFYSLKDANEQL